MKSSNRACCDDDLKADQVRRLVDRATSMLRTVQLGATAIVSANPLVFGIARMYGILAGQRGISVEVFRDVETASRWLDQFQPQ